MISKIKSNQESQNSRPSASNFKSFSQALEQFFLTEGQNNFDNKIPFLPVYLTIYGIGAIKNPSTYLYAGKNKLSGEIKNRNPFGKGKKSPKRIGVGKSKKKLKSFLRPFRTADKKTEKAGQ